MVCVLWYCQTLSVNGHPVVCVPAACVALEKDCKDEEHCCDVPRPRSTKAGKSSASQANQPLNDCSMKPLLAVQTEVLTGEHRGTWDKARVGHPCGTEVAHPTGNLGAAQASTNHPWAIQTSATKYQSAPPAPRVIHVHALARRLVEPKLHKPSGLNKPQ
ncbi:hypothetical protein MRX96_017017 [Rhipicephalus microplus]|uniref:uncharacterized protein LOC142776226 n=1 Tax=Rhipicephalus microplus TaxID=6941 RepID=UPI003F6A766C